MSSLAARAPKMVERRHGDARLAMGLGPQPPPATLPTRMPMLPAGPCNHHGAADPAGQRRRRSSRSTAPPIQTVDHGAATANPSKNDDGAQGIQIPQSTSADRRRAAPPPLAAASSSEPPRRAARGRMVGEQGKMRSRGLVGAPESTLVEKINRRGKRKRKIMVGRWLVGCFEPHQGSTVVRLTRPTRVQNKIFCTLGV
jgi:hypothetical protein